MVTWFFTCPCAGSFVCRFYIVLCVFGTSDSLAKIYSEKFDSLVHVGAVIHHAWLKKLSHR